jgi:two-component system OmpR family sensor kinase
MLERLSLRARLLLGVVTLSAVGLAVAGAVTYRALETFLIHRTDSSLDDAHGAVRHDVGHDGNGPDGGPVPGGLGVVVPGDYVALRTLGGVTIAKRFTPQFDGGTNGPPPKLPASIALPSSANTPSGDRVAYFTVDATHGDLRYRVRASIEAGSPNQVLLIAAPLNGVDSTLHRLLFIELLVAVSVLAAIAVLGSWVVKVGLRPLTAIGHTASAIAAGDLSRRVERAETRTEVGRLGLALNVMLSQIESSLRALEASERKLRRFVADASHELRTPLAAVRAYAELFDRGADVRPDDLARSMRGIGRESERMSLLVDDLMLLARLDENRPLENEPVELGKLVHEAVDAAQAVEPNRPITFDEDDAAVVLGDRDRLRQAIDNLLANVRAHTPPATPVHVSVSSVNGSARIDVADEGPGLTAEQLEHVFERFYRVDASRARASGGAGLGLSIVAAVAAAHGGTAEAHSEPGAGATFTIELPLSA